MSPFTLFYSKNDIIELTMQEKSFFNTGESGYVFKTYQKVEANLEKTLLKISFNDLEIMKGIIESLNLMLK